LTAAVAIGATSASARPPDLSGKRSFTCFQANAYIGGEIANVLTLDPSDPDFLAKLVQTVTETYLQIIVSDPPARMAVLARQIALAQPELVALEEVTRIEKAPATPQGPGEFTVQYDFLDLLLNTLADLEMPYQVAVVTPEMDVTLPFIDIDSLQPAYARAIDREVILVRSDLPPGTLHLTNPQTGHFATRIQFPELGVSVDRGWCSVDVFSRGELFRFICTHLETEAAIPIQFAQAQELLAGPANVNLPVVIAGDLNADPFHRNGSPTYDLFPQAGFQDAWPGAHPDDPEGGLTWGHDPDLADPDIPFVRRIDLVLYRAPGFVPTQIDVFDIALDRTEPPLWFSDHAAVGASFTLLNERAAMGSWDSDWAARKAARPPAR